MEKQYIFLMHSLCLKFTYCLPAIQHIHVIRTGCRLRENPKFPLEIIYEFLHPFCTNCRFLRRLAAVPEDSYNKM